MKVLITGGRGQLGRELQRTVPEEIDAVALGEGECDITSMQSIDQVVADIEPALIINAAAYTAVDDAESDPDFANQVNADGIENLARAAQTCKARIIHVSTDFVFDGESVHPYTPDSRVNPINAYGRSKAEGERRPGRCRPGERSDCADVMGLFRNWKKLRQNDVGTDAATAHNASGR